MLFIDSMEIIRKIIKEELVKALNEINSSLAVPQVEDQILYDFKSGRLFGSQKLAKNISGLDSYYMNDYFPRSEFEEGWMFEIDINHKGNQIIEVTHQVREDESYWNLRIADAERGSDQPQITYETGFIKNYSSFIEAVNSTIENRINPNFL